MSTEECSHKCCAQVKHDQRRCKYAGRYTWEGRPYCKLHLPVEECAVCYEAITNRSLIKLNCSHIFHAKCLKKWVNSDHLTCPMCRAALSDAVLDQLNPKMQDAVQAFLIDFQSLGLSSQQEVDRFITDLLNLHIIGRTAR